ncbi:MAG TPA: ABC transporter permease [Pilimelia sp.]|nr:ABC transporter permease [Pilimelia sp.]
MAVEERTGATALTAPAPVATRPPAVRHFARLKLRVLRNGLRGQSWRIVLFVCGALFGLWFAGMGFLFFTSPALAWEREADVAAVVLGGGGALVVLGWLFLPLVFFGVDETLDPARFALLPLPRRTLVAGLLTAGLIGIPAAATAVATGGSILAVAALGGWVAALVQAVGVAAGLLLCLTISRSVTSGFATLLRSRRMRDLAAIILALFAALLAPIQISIMAAMERADLDQLVMIARVVGWTPLGAPYTAGLDVAEGRPLAALAKLAGTAAVIWALLVWWGRSLESAMVGTETSGARRSRASTAPGRRAAGAVAQLFPRALWWAPADRYGALVAREVRYWWRDARRRANLITIAVMGVFVPLSINLGLESIAGERPDTAPAPFAVTMSMLFVGALAALTLANQFGFDGSAYAANVIAGVPGRTELGARMVGFSVYIVPMLTLVATVVVLVIGRPGQLAPMLGGLYATYGAGLAANLYVSVLGAYALPETSNPFAISTGAGVAKSLLSLVAFVASLAVCAPLVVAALLLGDAWVWLALPVGLAYGLGAAALGGYLAGDVLDRRAPELLAAVSPRR